LIDLPSLILKGIFDLKIIVLSSFTRPDVTQTRATLIKTTYSNILIFHTVNVTRGRVCQDKNTI